ncbi:MAG: DUF3619 family protein [Dechloromonas sp.]|nr:DUF3619 family protein [Dechloromonas sp.]
MNEERYASRVRQALNHGLKDILPASARRLEAARHLALSRQQQEVPRLALAGQHGHGHFHFSSDKRHLRQTLAVLALLLGMWISFYMDSLTYVSAIEEVDSALLSDDLPPEAFLDNDFFEWLIDDTSAE